MNEVRMDEIKVIPTGGELTLRTGDAPKVIDPYEYRGFRYTALTAGSFTELVKAKGSQASAIIFMDDAGFCAILDDSIKNRPQDRISYKFESSTQRKEWGAVLGANGEGFTIKKLTDFLKRREEGEIESIEDLLFAVQNFKYATLTAGDFTYDSRNNYTFSIKVNEAEGTVRIPTAIIAKVEIYKGSGFFQDVEVEIDIHKPKDAGEQPVFHLSCPKWERYVVKAKDHEYETLIAALADWLVVTGKPE